MEVGADYLAGERQKAEFDLDSMKVVWAGSTHALNVSDRMARLVASDPVEETKEDELIKLLWRIAEKKKSERSLIDIALLVDTIIAVIEHAANTSDRLRIMELLYFPLSVRQLQRAILNDRVLSHLKHWLKPLPTDYYNDINVRSIIQQILLKLPIDMRELMKSSGIEEAILFLSKAEEEDGALTRERAISLVDKWHVDENGPDIKKLKTCEEDVDDDLFLQMTSYNKMIEFRKSARGITGYELMKLGMTYEEYIGERTVTEDEDNLYVKVVNESGGYDVPEFPDVDLIGHIQNIPNLDSMMEKLTTYVNVAIQENCSDLKLVKILKANTIDFRQYYITFEAEEADCQIKAYQTLVFVGLGRPGDKIEVDEFRQRTKK